MAGIAGLVSAGASIYGALSGSDTASNVQLPPQFSMPNMAGAAQGAYSGIQGLQGQDVPGQTVPLYQQTAMQQYNNPYAKMFQQGAGVAGGMGQQAGQTAFGAGGNAINTGQGFQQAGQSLVPYAQQVAQTGFDPQNQLHDYLQQQNIDATRAAQAARGVATTPYGAAGEALANQQFNMNWENQQLARQAAGGQAATNMIQGGAGAANAGTGMTQAGAGLQSGGASTYANASGLPYSAYGQIGSGQFGALNNLQSGVSGAQSIGMTPVQAYLNYLGVGNQAGSVANQGAQVALNQAGMAFNQNQTLAGGLGAGLAGLGKAYSSGMPGASSGWNWLNSSGGGASGQQYNPGPAQGPGY